MIKGKINTSTFCFLEKKDAGNMLSNSSCCDDDESLLLLVWDDERAAKFAAFEKKMKHSKAHKQREEV